MLEELDKLIEELADSKTVVYKIPSKIASIKKTSKTILCKNRIHKYMRFNKTNKTFKTNLYYCVMCPSFISIDQIFGRTILCWKCEKEFIVGIKNMQHKPICSECK